MTGGLSPAPMSDAEFRTIIAEIGTSPTDFAHAIGVGIRVAQRWARGNAPIPPAVASLLRIMRAVALKDPYPVIAQVMREQAAILDQAGSPDA